MGSGSRKIGVVLAAGVMVVAVSPARGALWSVHQTPFSGLVSSVSCVSAGACIAVGGGGSPGGTDAMGWDGRRWRLQATPEPRVGGSLLAQGGSGLDGVSCTSSKVCVAVGSYLQSILYDPNAMHTVPVAMPFADRWDGTGWSLLPFPSLPPDAQQGGLEAVSCTSGSACEAIGKFLDGRGGGGLFAERWDGSSWSLESMPDPVPAANVSQPGTNINGLSLSCASGSFCTAVGGYDLNSGGGQSFAERWDGSSWSIETTAEIADALDPQLKDVSCTSPSACVAVGEYNVNSSPQGWRTLAERWDGTTWSVRMTPNAPGGSSQLAGVSCTSSSACTALGETDLGAGFQPLVERTDGTRWSIARFPSVASGALLQGVSCTSSTICMAVGNTPSGVFDLRSAPASAKLTGISARCTRAPLRVHVTGTEISSVAWSLDGKPIKGHRVRRGARYVASIKVWPGRHKLTVKVKFTVSSQTQPLEIRRDVQGCSPAR